MLNAEGKLLQNIIEKLDHKNIDKVIYKWHNFQITWSEFLHFLEDEGQKREIVNDAQIYGVGIKRLEDGPRIKVRQFHLLISYREEKNLVEYYIDNLCFIQFKQF